MLFIKNLTNLDGSEIEVGLTGNGKEVSVSLTIAKESPITLAKSTVEGVASALKKSVEYIGGIVDVLKTDGTTTTTCLMSKKATELNFLVKDTKTVLKETKEFPVTIGTYDEKDEVDNVHYPRDMILFIVPRIVRKPDCDGYAVDYSLVVDRRNLGAATVTKDIGDYRVIGMFVKWPIWMRLKFPAYAYIKGEKDEVLGAIKLGYKTEKKVTRNQVQDVDVKEAVDYLAESFRILKENRDKKEAAQGNNTKDRRPAFASRDIKQPKAGNTSNKGADRNHGRVGFPSKFKSGNNVTANKGGKNKKNGRRR